MQVVLDSAQLDASQRALLGPGSKALIDLIFGLDLDRPLRNISPGALQMARELGWVHQRALRLTVLGELVADPLREYRFWLERERRLHAEHVDPLLSRESYRGKSVLEVGCGFGCNLFSLTGLEGRFVGVEPIALYRQFTRILAERERIEPPQIVDGRGESLPFPDAEFDVVVCYSSHQYMDIKRAVKEMARVLKPGGRLQIVGGTLGPFAKYSLREVVSRRSSRVAATHGLVIGNTLAYCAVGRRLYTPRGPAATTAPIYPPRYCMDRWLQRAGLRVRRDLFRRIQGDGRFIAERPEPSLH